MDEQVIASSRWYRTVFPSLYFGGSIAFLVLSFPQWSVNADTYLNPIFAILVGLVVFRTLVWNLADEVIDLGDHLLYRRGGIELVVNISDISKVSHTAMLPQRVVLNLRKPCSLGSELPFMLPTSLNPFSKPAIVGDLTNRIDLVARENDQR